LIEIEDNLLDLPKGWILTTLEELSLKPKSDIVDGPFGSNLKASEYVDKGIPIIRLQNIERNFFINQNIKFINPHKAQELLRHSFINGDIVITKLGQPLGKACIIPDFFEMGIIVADLVRLRTDDKYVSKQYLVHLINSIWVSQQLQKQTKGTTRPRVNLQHIRQLQVFYPPLNEQKRIVAKIEALQTRSAAVKEELKTIKPLLNQFRQSVLAAAFRGDLTKEWRSQNPNVESAEVLLERIKVERRRRWEEAELEKMKANGKVPKDDKWKKRYKEPEPTDTEGLPELPAAWYWMSLRNVAWSVKDGPHYSPKYSEEGIPFISGGNIRPEGINFQNVKYISIDLHEELSKRCVPEKGDILYTKGGTTGIACVNTYDRPFNVWVHVAVLKCVPSIESFYLQHALNSPHCYQQSQKFTHGVGNQDLGLTRMVNITIPLAPLEEQKEIVRCIESLSVQDKK
jgi:type I restriction enzyme, S subunit